MNSFNSTWQATLISYRDAILAILPFIFLRCLWIVIFNLNVYFQFISETQVNAITQLFQLSFPVLMTTSLAYHLAINFAYERIHATFLSLILFFVFSGFVYQDADGIHLSDNFVFLHAVLIPAFVSALYLLIKKHYKFSFDSKGRLPAKLTQSIDATLPYLLIFLAAMFLNQLVINLSIAPLAVWISEFSVLAQSYFYVFICHLLWLIGIHGSSAFQALFDTSFAFEIYTSDIPYITFLSLFSSFGGAGCTWSLIISILLFSKNTHAKSIAKMSIPFALVNINEILLFGLPVIYNPRLAIPFILVPLANQSIAYILFSTFPVEISGTAHWMMPVLINGWIASDGSVYVLFVQVFLIVLGVFIYKPFLNHFDVGSTESLKENVIKALELNTKIELDSDVRLNQIQTMLNNQLVSLKSHMKKIISGELMLYYQPQYCSETGKLIGLEALLRLKYNNRIHGPTFLEDFSAAGMTASIDRWVVDQAMKDMVDWQEEGLPLCKVSINLAAESLLSDEAIAYIIQKLSGFPVVIEITESSYIQNLSFAKRAISQLRTAGFQIAIDDFGSGYSSLSMLSQLDADIVKLDRQFLQNISSEQGRILYLAVSSALCHLGFSVVAEGVETYEELTFVRRCNIDCVQGYYYEPAMTKTETQSILLLHAQKQKTSQPIHQ